MTIEELEVLKKENAAKAKEILQAEDGVVEDAQKLLDENNKINEKIEALKSVEEQLLPVKNIEVIKETKMSDIIMPKTISYKSLPFEAESNREKALKAYAFGQFALALAGNAKAKQWLKDNGSPMKAVNETTASAGGFLVPDQLVADLIFLREQYGVVRRNATVRTMTSDTYWHPKNSASTTAYWVGESAAITQSQPTFDRVEVLAKKMGILTAVTSEVNEDAIIEIGVALAQDMAWKFSQEEDRVMMIGTGVAGDGGITGFIQENLNVASNLGTVAAATGSAANYNAVTLANLRAMVGKLALYADNADAKFYMSKAFFQDVVCNRLDALSGNAALDLMNFQNGRPTLYGYDIEFSQNLTQVAAGANNAPLCALANLKTGSILGDRRQVQISVSSDYLFNTDEIAFKATERVGFKCHDPGTSTAIGSVVVLKRTT